MDPIYLDNSASTPVLEPVWEAMRPYFLHEAANPASSHRAGQKARQALEDAREQIAHLLDAYPDEVIFTSGATEDNHVAIWPGFGTWSHSGQSHRASVRQGTPGQTSGERFPGRLAFRLQGGGCLSGIPPNPAADPTGVRHAGQS